MTGVNGLNLSNSSEDIVLKIINSYIGINQISIAAKSILDTDLSAMDMEGFSVVNSLKDKSFVITASNEVNKKLNDAKDIISRWEPEISQILKNELSEAINKFGSEFIQIGEGIISEINENPEMQKGDSVIENIIKDLRSLKDKAEEVLLISKRLNDEYICKIQLALEDYCGELNKTIKEIEREVNDLGFDINNVERKINTLNETIAKEREEIAKNKEDLKSRAKIAAITSILSFGISSALIIEEKIRLENNNNKLQDEINKALSEIEKEKNELKFDTEKYKALKSTQLAESNKLDMINRALVVIDDVETMWSLMEKLIERTINDLDKAEEKPSIILSKVFTQKAINNWKSLEEMIDDFCRSNSSYGLVEVRKINL